MTYGAIYPYTWWGNRQDLGFGTSYPFLLNRYGGAAAAYSLRSLSSDNLNVVRVRRDSDNEERDFRATEVSDGTLQSWVNGELDALPLDTATAAAAYSLRNLKTSYSGSVVRVRRSSDNAEEDFTAAEVADGTLENWVNTDVVKYESDFSSTEDFLEFNGTGAAAQTIGGVSDAYKFTLSGGNGQHFAYKSGLHSIGKQYSITADVYIPSANVNCDGVVLSLFGSQDLISTNTLDQWVTLTSTYTANYANLNFFALDGASKTINADGDVFYLKNIVVTQTSADGFVTTWYDQAGSNNATQGTASRQPKIVDAGSLITENGKAAVSFDGVDDSIATSNNFIANTDLSFFTLHKFNSLTTKPQDILSQGATNLSDGFKYGMSGSGQNQFYLFLSATASYNDGNTTISQELHSLINTISATTLNINSIDTSLSISGIAGRVGNNNDPLTIGQRDSGGGYYNGKMQEILVYTSDQSTNRTKIENNISTYYDIYDTSANGYVATWYDQSVNGNNATQATASAQPQIVSNGVIVTENGKAALKLDGVNNHLRLTLQLSTPLSLFAIINEDGTNDFPYVFGNSIGSTADVLTLGFVKPSNTIRNFIGGINSYVDSDYTGHHLFTSIMDSSNSYLGKDGIVGTTTNNASGTSSSSLLWIFRGAAVAAAALKGTAQELILYSSNQTDNRADIENEINNYYTIYAGNPISGLLYDYPSSAAAYSVRQLTIYDNDYKETLVKVRRSSDNAEVDVKADTNYEISLNSFTSAEMSLGDWIGSDDGYVVTWYDQSGNENDATQSTASSQPQLISGGVVNLENGKAALDFDGSDDTLSTTLASEISQPFSTFSVSKENLANDVIIGSATNTSGKNFAIYTAFGSGTSNYLLFNDRNGISSSAFTTNQKIISTISNDTNSELYLNGTGSAGIYSGNDGLIDFRISGVYNVSEQFNGNVQEVILYSDNQSANRTGIETNINNYFNIYP